jgi:hypothetical protein
VFPALSRSSGFKQQFHDIPAPEHGCHHQGRPALVVARIVITAGDDQALCDFGFPLERNTHQTAVAFGVRRARTCSLLNQKVDGFRLPVVLSVPLNYVSESSESPLVSFPLKMHTFVIAMTQLLQADTMFRSIRSASDRCTFQTRFPPADSARSRRPTSL